ncbi:putative PAN6 Pantoate-beta-alanine ligase [Naematelia encephala]|uniref:Pantoate--beta-alanine ligase n=1 Tax=Naematelia encephala TaxID=71784 RepID=A0A1Y2AS79_9TREE|nr:putative PAN6 Pantoate-beta-alanine ligase [Naematelia encephala]
MLTLKIPRAGHVFQRRFASSSSQTHIPVIRTLGQLRRWRQNARDRKLDVGVIPTMGALHEGHLNLIRTSLQRHALTVMTLFVNPMQFAPTEDLSSYPRNMERDLALLLSLVSSPDSGRSSSVRGLGVSENESHRPSEQRTVRGLGVSEHDNRIRPAPDSSATTAGGLEKGESPLIVFAPTPDVMYPLKGELQDLGKHRGVSVDVRGFGDVMEGASRPQFFKGVATVCTKLFNAVEPDHAYFGQKDIQQALLLKIMLSDLLLNHPTPDNLHILPTTRDPQTHLALSSRNAYLSPSELRVAPVLHQALSAARQVFLTCSSSSEGTTGEEMISAASQIVSAQQEALEAEGSSVDLRLDYIEVFDKHTFEPVRGPVEKDREMVVAGALWVGRTRLIDNLLLGWDVA